MYFLFCLLVHVNSLYSEVIVFSIQNLSIAIVRQCFETDSLLLFCLETFKTHDVSKLELFLLALGSTTIELSNLHVVLVLYSFFMMSFLL